MPDLFSDILLPEEPPARLPKRPAGPSPDKLRGGYYTPGRVAAWLCRWAVRSPTDTVLEPSCGDGAFLEEAGSRLLALGATPRRAVAQILGVEITPVEAIKARERLRAITGSRTGDPVAEGDFFGWHAATTRKFSAVVGNPPFIRYQNFPEPSRARAMELMSARGLRPNKLTNIWVPFVVGAADLLAEGGRMAMVLPAELLQVTYAGQLRVYLADHFARIQIVACNHLLFDKAEQEVVLLLADGYRRAGGDARPCAIELIETQDAGELLALDPLTRPVADPVAVDHSTEKWLKYFLTPAEVGFMRRLRTEAAVAPLSRHATIDVGVVTGKNEFFVVARDTIERYGLRDYVVPLVGRSSQLKGAVINRAEWEGLAQENLPVHLLMMGTDGRSILTPKAKEYVRTGEAAGHHAGYKCSIRSPWYAVPSVWVPDCFFFRQIYDFPRVVVNRARATSTDTIHRMKCKGTDPALVATNLFTHLSAASAEIEGRSYGGGVLELEPTEAERMLVPAVLHPGLPVAEVDRLVRAGKVGQALEENDRLVLGAAGLTAAECGMLKAIWARMRDRRVGRRKAV